MYINRPFWVQVHLYQIVIAGTKWFYSVHCTVTGKSTSSSNTWPNTCVISTKTTDIKFKQDVLSESYSVYLIRHDVFKLNLKIQTLTAKYKLQSRSKNKYYCFIRLEIKLISLQNTRFIRLETKWIRNDCKIQNVLD